MVMVCIMMAVCITIYKLMRCRERDTERLSRVSLRGEGERMGIIIMHAPLIPSSKLSFILQMIHKWSKSMNQSPSLTLKPKMFHV